MASLDFPSNPSDQQTYTLNGITYQYNAAIGAWLTVVVGSQPVTLAANTQVLYSNNGLISGSNGLVFNNSANTLYANAIIANSINVITDMRVTGNLRIGTGTVTITNNSISAASIVVGGSAIPSGDSANLAFATANASFNTSNASFGKANTALQNTSGTFAGNLSVSGNVGISTSSSNYKLDVNAGFQGQAANSQVFLQRFYTPSSNSGGNSNYLEITDTRTVTGTSWNGCGARIQHKVDADYQAYIQFNGNNDYGLSFGSGASTGVPTSVPERMRIDSSGRITTPYQPRVQAYKTIGGWDTLTGYYIFNTAAVNVGGHYNTSTGLFTCPTAGYYKVTCGILLGYGAGASYYTLYKNGAAYSSGGGVYLNPYSTSIHSTIGQSWIINCAINDSLGIYVTSAASGVYGPGWNNLTIELLG